MTTGVTFTRAMLGYALWVAVEDSLRNWISRKLIELYGANWTDQIPTGIWNTLLERYNQPVKASNLSQVRDILEYSDFPDLFNIVKYKKHAKSFLPSVSLDDIDYYNEKLYALRNQIAHKPHSFNVRNLDELLGAVEWLISVLGSEGQKLHTIKEGVEKRPEAYALDIPEEFIQSAKLNSLYKITNNLPPMDYEYDGGFIGRTDELRDVQRRLLDKRLHPIITISGAGGVGKTALAHRVCENILINHATEFNGLVWISAKKDRLTLSGIEEIEPTAKSFEEVLDAILSTFGFTEYLDQETTEKVRIVQEVIFDDHNFSILLVIDNLETILHDKSLIEYIKDIPLPHKVLITSRVGLGEIERRIPLKELSSNDAVRLFRTIAIEKSLKNLAQLPDEIIKTYIQKMSAYPLVIKWVVGQAALNKDIDRLVQSINSTDSDISKFCFEFIYEHMLSDNAKLVLRCLAASEQDLTQAALMHVAELNSLAFEDVMMELEQASLVIPNTEIEQGQQRIITKYGILPLTKGYLTSREDSGRDIKERLKSVQALIEGARRAKRQYELSLEFLGAESEEELIASKYIQTAFTRNQVQDYEGAVEAIKRAEEIAPKFAAVYRSWAVIEQNAENFDRAVELFEKAVNLKPNDPISWYHWGNLEKKLANYENARTYLNKALELVEDKTSVYIALGNVEKQDSNFKYAIELFEHAIELAKSDSTRITDRDIIIASTSMADTHYRWAEAYEYDSQLDTAIDHAMLGYKTMLQVVELGSYDTKTRETQMKCMLLLGLLLKKTKKPDEARLYLEKVIEMRPQTWSRDQRRCVSRACYHLIPILLDANEVEYATQVYDYGRSCLNPNDGFAEKYEGLNLLLSRRQRYEGVIVHIVADRGFGFIKCEEISADNLFAHITEFIDEVSNRDFALMREVWVSFSVEQQADGRNAAKAIRILR